MLSYAAYLAPWSIIVIYLVTFVIVSIAFQEIDLSKILKKNQKTWISMVIYFIFTISFSFLVGSFIIMIAGASSASINGLIYG